MSFNNATDYKAVGKDNTGFEAGSLEVLAAIDCGLKFNKISFQYLNNYLNYLVIVAIVSPKPKPFLKYPFHSILIVVVVIGFCAVD